MLKRLTTPKAIRAILMAAVAVVFLRPLAAQPAATLVSMTGQVSILQDINSPSSATALFVGSPIQARALVVTGPASYAKFQLADGSYFEVFENSKLQFHEDYGFTHLLNVILGHIRVFIDHSKGPNPNSVTTPTAVISVRGTIFDIEVEDADGTTLVTLEEGWVHVRNQTAPGAEPDLKKPGDWVRIFRGQGLLGNKVNNNGLQKLARGLEDFLRVYAAQHPGGIGGGVGGVGTTGGIPGAQGDKGKGGAAPPPPPPAPPASAGH